MTDSDPTLDAALDAHDRGWTPTPLRPALKRPTSQGWPSLSYDSREDVRQEFLHAGEPFEEAVLNLGIALGAKHGGLIDIDLDHHRALAIASQVLPETPMRSGRPNNPGSHFWYVSPDYDPGVCQYKLPDGSVIVEFRGGGGQTVVPPSHHPDGDDYEWAGEPWGGDAGPMVLDAPGAKKLHATVMSIALLVTLADNWPRKGGRHTAFLPLVGGLLRDADEEGRPRVHPLWDSQIESIIRLLVGLTNDTDGARVRIVESVETTRKKILRGDKVQGWPTLAKIIGEDHVGKAREIIEKIEELGGMPRAKLRRDSNEEWYDESPGLRVVSEDERVPEETPQARDARVSLLDDGLRDPMEERLNQWEGLDLGPYLRGNMKPIEPGLLMREDGVGLLYPNRVNLIYGEGGSGKTLIALDLAARMIRSGQRVMFIDMEDEPVNTISRFHALGLDNDQIEAGVIYVHPEGQPLGEMHVDRFGQQIRPGPEERDSDRVMRDLLNTKNPALVIVDGTTTLYRIHGLDTNGVQGTDLVGGWLRSLTNGQRRTVLLIDHTSKNASAESGPIGSQHKIAMVQGVALRVGKGTRPRIGSIGNAPLLVGKDRLGMVMGKSSDADMPVAAEVTFDSATDPAFCRISYAAPNMASTPSVQIVDSRKEAMLDALREKLKNQGGNLDAAWMRPKEIRLAANISFETSGNEKNLQTELLQRLMDSGEVEHNGVKTSASKYRCISADPTD